MMGSSGIWRGWGSLFFQVWGKEGAEGGEVGWVGLRGVFLDFLYFRVVHFRFRYFLGCGDRSFIV